MRFRKQVDIDAPPAKLWRYLTEPELIKQWITELVDDVPEDPAKTTGVGVVSTMRMREGGKVVAYRSEVIEWESGRRLAIRLSGGSFGAGMAIDVGYTIAPRGSGSRLDFEEDLPLKGLYVLMGPIMWLALKGNAAKTLARLAEVTRG